MVERIGDATLYQGDVLAVLAELPEESVHCVVTSPPYWGLRDYGTGTWEGGNAECDHRGPPLASRKSTLGSPAIGGHGKEAAERYSNGTGMPFREVCGKCGARRIDQQIGLEDTPEQYVAKMVTVFREVRRVLRADGTCWVNLGDSYAGSGKGPTGQNGIQGDASCGVRIGTVHGDSGHTSGVTPPPGLKAKDLCGIPWRVAFALQADGWYLRSDIIWSKPNPMPESVTDRPTKAHEYVFLLTKSARYWYDADAVREDSARPDLFDQTRNVYAQKWNDEDGREYERRKGVEYCNPLGRNRRTVWTIATEPFPGAHFATFPRKLVEPCILAGCPRKCCPACGAPWEKEVERVSSVPQRVGGENNWIKREHQQNGQEERAGGFYDSQATVTGEHPTCACGQPPVPGTVLEPFLGSGTTLVVALTHARRGIGIELKPEYFDMACNRLRHGTVDPEEVAQAERQGVLFG